MHLKVSSTKGWPTCPGEDFKALKYSPQSQSPFRESYQSHASSLEDTNPEDSQYSKKKKTTSYSKIYSLEGASSVVRVFLDRSEIWQADFERAWVFNINLYGLGIMRDFTIRRLIWYLNPPWAMNQSMVWHEIAKTAWTDQLWFTGVWENYILLTAMTYLNSALREIVEESNGFERSLCR